MKTKWVGTPEGTKDRLYGACTARRELEEKARQLFAQYGYRPIATPALELYDLFACTGQPLPPESMCKLIDRSGRILAMRPDSTTPVARVVSSKLAQNWPVRLYYIQDVYRSGGRHTGHPAETRQAGVEYIGLAGRNADLEILALAAETLSGLGAAEFRIELGHAALFRALAARLDAPPEEVEELRTLIEQKNFAALNDRLDGFSNRSVCESIRRLCALFGGGEVFAEAGTLGVPEADEALVYMRDIYTALEHAGFGDHIQMDLGLVHQMDYYTGVVFRGYVSGVGHAVLDGGRYDNLMGTLGRPAPATGFAVDLDALCDCRPCPDEPQPDTLLHFSASRLNEALAEQKKRKTGSCELSPCDTIDASIQLARARGMKRLVDIDDGGTEVAL